MKRKVVYDTEIFKNLLLYVFYDIDTQEIFVFQISPYQDDRRELMAFLKEVELMIGYNNLQFDYPLLHYLFKIFDFKAPGRLIVDKIYKKTQELIKAPVSFKNIVRRPVIPQVDLYKIHHFDNKAKMTSLKLLEFVLRMDNIAELPFKPEECLNEEQILKVVKYCNNDVFSTEKLRLKTTDQIALREEFSQLYSIDMTNFNNAKLGEQTLIRTYKKRTGIEVLGKTRREYIDIKDVIFPYVSFEFPEFNSILQWFQEKRITQTKKVFAEIPLTDLGPITPYCNYTKPMLVKGKLKTLNVVYRDFQYDFGTGGIHGSIAPGIYDADDIYDIEDIDVQSYYPNLAIKNKLYPAHLGEIYCVIYEEIFNERQKHPKGSTKNKGLKEALNASYGKSNSEFSELYDPQYTMATTINGQLLLCMLAERLVDRIPRLTVLQINTDGITVKYPKSWKEHVAYICASWMNLTHLILESVNYRRMIIRDVNNYIAIKLDGGVKRKGAFEYKRELHQNHSMLVVPKAVEAYFVHGTPVEEFIINHQELYDFFKRTKLDKKSRLIGVSDQEVIELNRVTRYFVANQGYRFIKIMPPLKKKTEREQSVESGYECFPVNILSDYTEEWIRSNLNYDYYITQANKIINAIHLHQNFEEDES